MMSLKKAGLCLAILSIAATAAPTMAADWMATVTKQIAATQKYPRSAVIREDEGTAKIRVRVAPDGTISGVELLEKSGSEILDREAIRMPAKAGRMPPPPSGKAVAVDIPVRFKLS
ncbi:MAG: energy transducer TonB [Pacificimonas sp.]